MAAALPSIASSPSVVKPSISASISAIIARWDAMSEAAAAAVAASSLTSREERREKIEGILVDLQMYVAVEFFGVWQKLDDHINSCKRRFV